MVDHGPSIGGGGLTRQGLGLGGGILDRVDAGGRRSDGREGSRSVRVAAATAGPPGLPRSSMTTTPPGRGSACSSSRGRANEIAGSSAEPHRNTAIAKTSRKTAPTPRPCLGRTRRGTSSEPTLNPKGRASRAEPAALTFDQGWGTVAGRDGNRVATDRPRIDDRRSDFSVGDVVDRLEGELEPATRCSASTGPIRIPMKTSWAARRRGATQRALEGDADTCEPWGPPRGGPRPPCRRQCAARVRDRAARASSMPVCDIGSATACAAALR